MVSKENAAAGCFVVVFSLNSTNPRQRSENAVSVGAVLHSAGRNDSAEGRRTLLSGYQLSWLRPENNFWGHTPLREAIHSGKGPSFSKTFVELLGHWCGQLPFRFKF